MAEGTTTAPAAEAQGRQVYPERPDWMIEQLPGYLASDPGMRDFLRIFQDVANTILARADNRELYFDRGVAPVEFVHFIGRWVDLYFDRAWTLGQQRHFLFTAGPLFRKKGRKDGISCFLETLVGGKVEIDELGTVRTRSEPLGSDYTLAEADSEATMVTVRVASTGGMTMDQLKPLVALHIPADTTFEVVLDESLAGSLEGTCAYQEEGDDDD